MYSLLFSITSTTALNEEKKKILEIEELKIELISYLSGKITLNMHKYLIHFTVNDIDVDS